MDPLVTLAANAPPGEKRYVLFTGAGLSKDAGLPTAWDLMLETAKLLRANDEEQPGEEDIQEWFLKSKYKDTSYAELIGGIYETPQTQQDFMRRVLRADEPGKGHKLIAGLAKNGVLRCVISTNFDDLIERACLELGIEIEVVTEENLKTTGPLIQCQAFRIYKPHGSIGATRLRNTPKDLERLHRGMENELVSVLRDHGLILLGYAAADPGIRTVFQRKKRHLYPTFWANLSEPSQDVRDVFGHEPLNFIRCSGASAFLEAFIGMHQKLSLMAPKEGAGVVAKAAENVIRDRRPDARAKVRTYWEKLIKELEGIGPEVRTQYSPDIDEDFVRAFERTVPLCAQFATVANAAAEMDDKASAMALHLGFQQLVPHYDFPYGVGGTPYPFEFDFWRFLGHELYVTLAAPLVRDRNWRTLRELLDREFFVVSRHTGEKTLAPFFYLNHPVAILKIRAKRLQLNNGIYQHALLLQQRHTEGALGDVMPFDLFMEADCFLFLASRATRYGDKSEFWWDPFSNLFLREPPEFVLESELRSEAPGLCHALGLKDDIQLHDLIVAAKKHVLEGMLYDRNPLYSFDPQRVASRYPARA